MLQKTYNLNIVLTTHSRDFLDAIDLFVMPSFFEGLPISLIEAQANGLKCLCSENITKEASINNMIKYLPINGEDSIGLWVNSIEEFSIKNNNRQNNDMSKSEFDIKNEVSRILEIYFRE